MIVQYCATCIAEMLHNTKHRDSSVNIPLSPDQHHCLDEAKWRIGGGRHSRSSNPRCIANLDLSTPKTSRITQGHSYTKFEHFGIIRF